MILTANLQLFASSKDSETLDLLLSRCAEARDYVTTISNETKVYRWRELNDLTYKEVRSQFQLPSNLTQSLIRQVSIEATKFKGKKEFSFREDASIPVINRYFKIKGKKIRLKTLSSWLDMDIDCWKRHAFLLTCSKIKEAKLFKRKDGKFFLHVACELKDAKLLNIQDYTGVDRGIVNLAVDSDAEEHGGEKVEEKQRIYNHRRKNLQKKGTKSAKRKLRKIAKKQSRFQRHQNHIISKKIISKAFDTCRGIALEDLKGIRDRIKVRRKQRSRMHNWGFYQLASFITYKGQKIGIPLHFVDARNTSRTCPECDYCHKKNRKTRDWFCCMSCGYSGPADFIAARNIRARALRDEPMVATFIG